MKFRKPLNSLALATAIAMLLPACTSLPPVPPVQGIQRDYDPGAMLKPQQEHDILELARLCGIDSPEKISTYFAVPTFNRIIFVKEADQVRGREIEFRQLEIVFKPWWRSFDTKFATKRLGNLYALGTRTNRLCIVEISDKLVRVRSSLPIERVQSILSLLDQGRLEFEDSYAEILWKRQVVLTNISRLELLSTSKLAFHRTSTPNEYEMSFSHGGRYSHDAIFRFRVSDDGKVLVRGVSIPVS